MLELPLGTKGEKKLRVTPDLTIDFLGVPGGRVLGTPWMIWFMEITARDSVLPFLEAGHDTVGARVDVRHLAATPLGMEVTFRSELLAIDGRRLHFRVEAFDDQEKIGEGTHERGIISVERFAARVQAKSSA